jgi:drug/metabolite transporter (DMT)-like permease
MKNSAHLFGVGLALLSALGYGVADFSGGQAARRHGPFQVLALVGLSGWLTLGGLSLVVERQLPTFASVLWATGAGFFGALGIAGFYRALALGRAALVAPTAAVVGAAVPFGFGVLTLGWPNPLQIAGLLCALAGIGMVSRASQQDHSLARQGLGLAILAGIGFGGFFICIAQVADRPFLAPLVVSRTVTLLLALVILSSRGQRVPRPLSNPAALIAGILDAGGNIFFMLAQQHTRLDLAAVLVCLAPAVTVLLSRIVLNELVSFGQWMGVLLCMGAVMLISA